MSLIVIFILSASDVAIFCFTRVAKVYRFRVYRFYKKYRNMFIKQHGGVNMYSYFHDTILRRENGLMSLIKTFK